MPYCVAGLSYYLHKLFFYKIFMWLLLEFLSFDLLRICLCVCVLGWGWGLGGWVFW